MTGAERSASKPIPFTLQQGFNVIADEVIWKRLWLEECLKVIETYQAFFVDFYCIDNEGVRRENVRGDRYPGWYRGSAYYLTVTQSIEKLSEMIPSNYLDAFIRIDADPNQFLMVVESRGIIVGTCHLTLMPSLTFQGGLRMNVEAVRIASSCRGEGVGEWMINQVLSLARKEGCKIIQLTTNKERMDAKRFYEKLRFKSTHEGMKMYL